MADKECPSCGADMKIATFGAAQKKVLKCDFCGHQEDLPDSVTIQTSEEISSGSGVKGGVVYHKKNVVIRRDDVQVQKGQFSDHYQKMFGEAGAGLSPYPPQKAIDEAMDALGDEAEPEVKDALERAREVWASAQGAVDGMPGTGAPPPQTFPDAAAAIREAITPKRNYALYALIGCLGAALIIGLSVIVAVFLLKP
jgi:Zn ribbon nucleic-acid-binding protein